MEIKEIIELPEVQEVIEIETGANKVESYNRARYAESIKENWCDFLHKSDTAGMRDDIVAAYKTALEAIELVIRKEDRAAR